MLGEVTDGSRRSPCVDVLSVPLAELRAASESTLPGAVRLSRPMARRVDPGQAGRAVIAQADLIAAWLSG